MENEHLLVAIIRNDLETALYETGHLLKAGATDTLENTWIHCLSVIAECVGLEYIAEFQACIITLGDIVENSANIAVDDAFLLTTRLGIMASRFVSLYVRQPIAKLKEKVIAHFPEGGTLNEAGKERYKSIIPVAEGEERTFVVRILAGLARIWADKEYDISRLAVEYLSRKKLVIPKPKWIMPSILDDADIMWVLWGAVLLFDPDNKVVATSYRLFCCNYKKQLKMERIGLLWSAFYHFSCSSAITAVNIWTAEERSIYEHVKANIRNLWQQVVGTTEEQQKEVEYVWADYQPRGNVCQVTDVPHFKEESRLLKIKENRRTIDKNETDSTNSRDRWLDFGE